MPVHVIHNLEDMSPFSILALLEGAQNALQSLQLAEYLALVV